MLEKSDILVFDTLGTRMGTELKAEPYAEAVSFWSKYKAEDRIKAQQVFYTAAEKAHKSKDTQEG